MTRSKASPATPAPSPRAIQGPIPAWTAVTSVAAILVVALVMVLGHGSGSDANGEDDRAAREAFAQRGKQTAESLPPAGRANLEEIVRDQGRGGFLLVDARPLAAWTAGRIPGALDRDHLAGVVEQAGRRRLPVIVYGATGEDPAAAALADQLRTQAVASVRVCTGGFDDWVSRHHDVQRGP